MRIAQTVKLQRVFIMDEYCVVCMEATAAAAFTLQIFQAKSRLLMKH